MTGTRSRASLARLAMPLVLWASLAGDAGAAAMPGDNVDEELLRLLKDTVVVADSFEDRYDAEVWLLDKSTELARLTPDKPKRLERLRKVPHEASEAGVTPEVEMALIEVESRFDHSATR